LKISTKGRYAIRMLLDMAEHKNDGFIALKDIAGRQDISKQYLEHIVSLLNTSDILRASRGKKGGYMLAREPSECKIGEILRITEGSLAPVACLDDKTNHCNRSEFCKTLSIWNGFYKLIIEYFDSITLQDMLDQYDEQSADSYVI